MRVPRRICAELGEAPRAAEEHGLDLLAEVPLTGIAADNAATTVNPVDVPINVRLPDGWTILVTNHAAPAANSAWKAVAVGGDY